MTVNQDTIVIIGTILAVGIALWRIAEPRFLSLTSRIDTLHEKVSSVEQRVIRLEGLFEGQQITENKIRFEELVSLITSGRKPHE